MPALPNKITRSWALALLLAALVTSQPSPPSLAQQEAPAPVEGLAGAAPAPAFNRLPSPARSSHELALPGRTLRFTATTGAIEVRSGEHGPLGEAGYVAYTLDGPAAPERPVVFAVNGGPGASSAWLHVGALGPWRLPLAPGVAPRLEPNAETWLDFADLVFIDPPGTGYSRIYEVVQSQAARQTRGRPGERPAGANPARQLWSVGGDTVALTDVIETWLTQNNRAAAPRMLVGESYGGFRAPRIAELMQRRKLPFDALVLVSPVIDFEGRRGSFGPGLYVNVLPAIAAVELERAGTTPSRALLTEVEDYARTDYLLDLMRGPRDAGAKTRVVAKVAQITGLPEPLVRNANGRVSGFVYAREGFRADGRLASVYDAAITATATAADRRQEDPFLGGLNRPLTEAMVALYRERLGWNVDRTYELQSGEVLRGWLWPNSPNPPEAMSALAAVLGDPRTRVLVTHGFSDLVTPYFASALQLDQLAFTGDERRIRLEVYPGGHMFYSRDASRQAFRRDARELLRERATIPSP